MKKVPMSQEQVYLFDLQGFVVLKQVVPQSAIEKANRVMEKLEHMNPAEFPPPLTLGEEKTHENLYIGNILEADPAMAEFMAIPEVLGVIEKITGGPYRLNHSFSISRWRGGHTSLHLGGTPLRHNTHYHCQNGEFFSPHTTAAMPLLPCRPEDGCYAAIPGSHKSNFNRPWGNHPQENPPLIPVLADPGDAIVFTEGLTHGSTVNTSGRPRRTLYWGYSVAWMTDWGSHNIHFSPKLNEWLNEDQRQLVALRCGDGSTMARMTVG